MPAPPQSFAASLCDGLPLVLWSVRIQQDQRIAVDLHADRPLSIASVGKILLLVAAAERIVADPGFAAFELRRPLEQVADSGLWQHLSAPALSVHDACVLIASVSDNLATNALLGLVGLDACNGVARALGCGALALHDRVRDPRSAGDPPRLATGSAADLVMLMGELRSPGILDRRVASMVMGWLGLNVDHSMSLQGLGVDPLVDGSGTHPAIANKTGTDRGVCADAGVIGSGPDAVVYAVIANWDGASPSPRAVRAAMGRMLVEGALETLAPVSSFRD